MERETKKLEERNNQNIDRIDGCLEEEHLWAVQDCEAVVAGRLEKDKKRPATGYRSSCKVRE